MVAIFLLLGAVVNVAVAWACVLWGSMDGRNLSEAEVQERLPPHVEVRPDYFFFHGFEIAGLGGHILSLAGTEIDSRGLESEVPLYIDLHAGWPCFGLRGTATMIKSGLSAPSLAFVPEGLMDLVKFPMLPLRPIWSGFAINTLFYATILWLVIPGPFALRRHLRRKRGLCVVCGYDLRHAEHDACPECGGLLPQP